MADTTSREVIEYIRKRDLRYNLHTVTNQQIGDVIELYEEFDGLEQKDIKSVGKLTLDIDCADAIKGLKAVQREAKETMKTLKEVDALLKSKCPNCNTYSLKTAAFRADNKTVANSTKCVNCDWSDHS